MAKKGENRELVTLKCTVCNEKNYRKEKNKINIVQNVDNILYIRKKNRDKPYFLVKELIYDKC